MHLSDRKTARNKKILNKSYTQTNNRKRDKVGGRKYFNINFVVVQLNLCFSSFYFCPFDFYLPKFLPKRMRRIALDIGCDPDRWDFELADKMGQYFQKTLLCGWFD